MEREGERKKRRTIGCVELTYCTVDKARWEKENIKEMWRKKNTRKEGEDKE